MNVCITMASNYVLRHSSHNYWNYMHKLKKSYIFHPGPLHGRRERHPHEAHQVEEKSIQLYILYMFYVQFFKPNRYELVSWMSELTRSPSGTSRATSWWSTARVYFLLNTYVLYMFYAQFFMTNPYKLVLKMSESTRSPSGTSRATSWWSTARVYFHLITYVLYRFYSYFLVFHVFHDKSI